MTNPTQVESIVAGLSEAMKRWFMPMLIGLFVAMVAHDLGVPWWRDWEAGDAFDLGLVAALIARLAVRKPLEDAGR